MNRKRIERAFKYTHEKREEREAAMPPDTGDEVDETKLEKGDLFAMIVSAFGVILPIALVVLLILAAVGYLFIFR